MLTHSTLNGACWIEYTAQDWSGKRSVLEVPAGECPCCEAARLHQQIARMNREHREARKRRRGEGRTR